MNMTLDEAIRHSEEIAETFLSQGVNEEHCRKCGEEHAQLAGWLKELKARRGRVIEITGIPELSAEEMAKLMRNSGPLTIMPNEPSSITIEKGDTIDRAAHTLIDFTADKAWIENEYLAYYHEDRLYSVRDTKRGVVSLVKAASPADAIAKVKRP